MLPTNSLCAGTIEETHVTMNAFLRNMDIPPCSVDRIV